MRPMSPPQDPDLGRLRQALRALDLEVLGRLNQRAALSLQIRSLREGDVKLVMIEPPEEAWLAELAAASEGPLPKESLRIIFRSLSAEARGLEQLVRVAFLEPLGGFGHAVSKCFFGSNALLEESPTTEAALEQVARGRVGFAVIPLESSTEGLVQLSVTALAKTDLPIVAERSISANYDWMGRPGSPRIEHVFATPHAHAACERFLQMEFPEAVVVDVRSPAAAAQQTAETANSACLVPVGCGEDFGLATLRANVGADSELKHRYAIVGSRPAMRTGNDTTCLLFGGDDAPGALHGILSQFAERGINLKKLQSRPHDSDSWEYVFYVEIGGHVSDRAVVTALEAVRRSTKYLKVLGSFPSES